MNAKWNPCNNNDHNQNNNQKDTYVTGLQSQRNNSPKRYCALSNLAQHVPYYNVNVVYVATDANTKYT